MGYEGQNVDGGGGASNVVSKGLGFIKGSIVGSRVIDGAIYGIIF